MCYSQVLEWGWNRSVWSALLLCLVNMEETGESHRNNWKTEFLKLLGALYDSPFCIAVDVVDTRLKSFPPPCQFSFLFVFCLNDSFPYFIKYSLLLIIFYTPAIAAESPATNSCSFSLSRLPLPWISVSDSFWKQYFSCQENKSLLALF